VGSDNNNINERGPELLVLRKAMLTAMCH